MPNSQECIHCGQHVDWEGEGVVTGVVYEKKNFHTQLNQVVARAIDVYFNANQTIGSEENATFGNVIETKTGLSYAEILNEMENVQIVRENGSAFTKIADGVFANTERNIEVFISLEKGTGDKKNQTTVRVVVLAKVKKTLGELKTFYDENIQIMTSVVRSSKKEKCFELSEDRFPLKWLFKNNYERLYNVHYQEILGEGVQYNALHEYPYKQYRNGCMIEFTATLEKCKINLYNEQ